MTFENWFDGTIGPTVADSTPSFAHLGSYVDPPATAAEAEGQAAAEHRAEMARQ